MKKMKISVDFDGTLVSHNFPRIGEDLGAVQWFNKILQKYPNDVELILWTMRDAHYLEDALDWCREHELSIIGYDRVKKEDWTVSPKIHVQLIIDDHALGMPITIINGKRAVVWEKAGPILLKAVDDWFNRDRAPL